MRNEHSTWPAHKLCMPVMHEAARHHHFSPSKSTQRINYRTECLIIFTKKKEFVNRCSIDSTDMEMLNDQSDFSFRSSQKKCRIHFLLHNFSMTVSKSNCSLYFHWIQEKKVIFDMLPLRIHTHANLPVSFHIDDDYFSESDDEYWF